MIIRQRKNFLNQKILFISVFSRYGGRQGGDRGVVFPFGAVGQSHQRQRGFLDFPDAFERFVVLEFQQRIEAGGLRETGNRRFLPGFIEVHQFEAAATMHAAK